MNAARLLPIFLVIAVITLVAGKARAQDDDYPSMMPADACGGSPGDPPIVTFRSGSALPDTEGPGLFRLRRWRERIRPDVRLVLLTGHADPTEPGYGPELAVQRAQSVRDLLVSMNVPPDGIWVRGVTVSPDAARDQDARLNRSVTLEDPQRAVTCRSELAQMQFRWFITHCAGQAIDVATQTTCDFATQQLADGDVQVKKER